MQELGCSSVNGYVASIQINPQEFARARELLTVTISRFFRDKHLWETLEKLIQQRIAERPGHSMRVWHAGCASGEEVYSFKIVWDQAVKGLSRSVPVTVWATDSNPVVLERGRAAIYPPSSLKELDTHLRDRYFIALPEGFAVRREIRGGIHWMRHDFVSESPPGTRFDLIFLRNNLLTYYDAGQVIPVFSKILGSLQNGGHLFIGSHERLPDGDFPLQSCEEHEGIYVKIPCR